MSESTFQHDVNPSSHRNDELFTTNETNTANEYTNRFDGSDQRLRDFRQNNNIESERVVQRQTNNDDVMSPNLYNRDHSELPRSASQMRRNNVVYDGAHSLTQSARVRQYTRDNDMQVERAIPRNAINDERQQLSLQSSNFQRNAQLESFTNTVRRNERNDSNQVRFRDPNQNLPFNDAASEQDQFDVGLPGLTIRDSEMPRTHPSDNRREDFEMENYDEATSEMLTNLGFNRTINSQEVTKKESPSLGPVTRRVHKNSFAGESNTLSSLDDTQSRRYRLYVAPTSIGELRNICFTSIGSGTTICVKRSCKDQHRGGAINVTPSQGFILKSRERVFAVLILI